MSNLVMDTNPDLEDVPEQLHFPEVARQKDDTLTTILSLANRLIAVRERVIECERALAEATDEMRSIGERQLPDLMAGLGLTELKLNNGQKIGIKTDYFASIPKATYTEAFDWLRARNMGGVIKEELSVPANFKEALAGHGVPFDLKRSIHPSTLKALVREQIEAGNDFPRELFGVHVANKAVVT